MSKVFTLAVEKWRAEVEADVAEAGVKVNPNLVLAVIHQQTHGASKVDTANLIGMHAAVEAYLMLAKPDYTVFDVESFTGLALSAGWADTQKAMDKVKEAGEDITLKNFALMFPRFKQTSERWPKRPVYHAISVFNRFLRAEKERPYDTTPEDFGEHEADTKSVDLSLS